MRLAMMLFVLAVSAPAASAGPAPAPAPAPAVTLPAARNPLASPPVPPPAPAPPRPPPRPVARNPIASAPGDNCPRTTSHYAGKDSMYRGEPVAPPKLTELPPAVGFMAVYRTVNGCEVPMTIVEYRTGR